jgi:hypothetical protein
MKQPKQLHSLFVIMALTCLMPTLFTIQVYAQSLSVSASSAQYTTYVNASGIDPYNGNIFPEVSRTNVSATPISDEFAFPNGYIFNGVPATNYAIANAGLFQVSDVTGWGGAAAEAVSELLFSPVADQIQMLGIEMALTGSPDNFESSAGQVVLMDLTANSQLWNYSFVNYWPGYPVQIPTGDNVPWSGGGPVANFTFDTSFLESHQYELMMIAASQAGGDDEYVQIQLTGLQVVPEPAVLPLFGTCIFGAAFLRRLVPAVVIQYRIKRR